MDGWDGQEISGYVVLVTKAYNEKTSKLVILEYKVSSDDPIRNNVKLSIIRNLYQIPTNIISETDCYAM